MLEETEGRISRIHAIEKSENIKEQHASYAQNSDISPLLQEAVCQLEAYSQGRLKKFDLPLLVQGSHFQKKVWQELMGIPYGQTVSYGEIARAAGNPRACRAVGMACHRNPLMIVVPCHRVLAAGKRLSGYAAGRELKRFLLKLEGASFF